ncbi:MAG: hypothetical protein AAGB32_04015 [Pseudomonadota bacterium]
MNEMQDPYALIGAARGFLTSGYDFEREVDVKATPYKALCALKFAYVAVTSSLTGERLQKAVVEIHTLLGSVYQHGLPEGYQSELDSFEMQLREHPALQA